MYIWIAGNESVSEFDDLKLNNEALAKLDRDKEVMVEVGEGAYYKFTLTDEFKRTYKKPVIITPLAKIKKEA